LERCIYADPDNPNQFNQSDSDVLAQMYLPLSKSGQRYPVKNRSFEYTFSAMNSKDKIKNFIPKFLPRRRTFQLGYDSRYPKLFLKNFKNDL
jgi:hypothetical protein